MRRDSGNKEAGRHLARKGMQSLPDAASADDAGAKFPLLPRAAVLSEPWASDDSPPAVVSMPLWWWRRDDEATGLGWKRR